MSAVWLRLRGELRARRRAAISLALLIGIGGGAVMAAAAGARRTGSAFTRLVSSTSASHAVLSAEPGGRGYRLEEVMSLPGIAAARTARLYLLLTGDLDRCKQGECLSVGVAQGDSAGGVVDEGKVVAGRRPDPTDPSEVALTVIGDEVSPLEIGDRIPLAGVPFDEPFFTPFAAAAEKDPLTLEVVGVVALPRDFPPQLGDETIHLQMTPAFLQRYDVPAFGLDDVVTVRLRAARDMATLREHVLSGDRQGVMVLDRVGHRANVERSMDLQALALGVLAGFAGLALTLIASQVIAREVAAASDEGAALSALGMTRSAIASLSVVWVAATATVAALLAAIVAVALSPLTPIGLARVAEPAPGVAVDATVIALGALAIVAVSTLLSVWPAWRAASQSAGRPGRVAAPPHTSATARAATRAGLAPAAAIGVRMALEPGSGRTAVPVRTTIATVVIGIAALIASLSFGASLDRLVDTPRLYGVPWDVSIDSEGSIDFASAIDRVSNVAGVTGVSLGSGLDVALFAGEQEIEALTLDPVSGGVAPPILEGRAPSATAETLEVVLGSATIRRLRANVGDTLTFTVPEVGRLRARVVGRGVIPTGSDVSAIGDAAWLSTAGLFRAAGLPADAEESKRDRVFLRLAPGVDPDRVTRDVASRFGANPDELFIPPVGTPVDLVSFGRVRALPFVVAGLLALIAAGALAHTLLTAIRRRRRDVAVLKALGFSSGQARATVGIQASVVTLVAAAVGVPLGVAAGRWAWTAFAQRQGVIAEPVVPLLALAVVIPAALVLANLIAAVPARTAARTQPAVVLRTE